MLFPLLLSVLSADSFESYRDIIRERTDSHGVAHGNSLFETGWASVLALQWQLHVDEGKGYRTVRPDQLFRTGQAFQLKVRAETELWIYVLNQNTSGGVVVLLPEKAEEHLRLDRNQEVTIPPDGNFRFSDPPGTERFRIIASPTKLPYINPSELFALDAGGQLTPDEVSAARQQQSMRDSKLTSIQEAQSRLEVRKLPLDEVLLPGNVSGVRGKDTVLLPPPTEDGQFVVRGATVSSKIDPILIDIKLVHGH